MFQNVERSSRCISLLGVRWKLAKQHPMSFSGKNMLPVFFQSNLYESKRKFNPLMPCGNKRPYIFTQTWNFQLQVYLSTYDYFLPPVIKVYQKKKKVWGRDKNRKIYVNIGKRGSKNLSNVFNISCHELPKIFIKLFGKGFLQLKILGSW